jgi:hypothetical protein
VYLVVMMTDDNDTGMIEPAAREAAHRELDRWMTEAEQAARDAWEDSRSGYLGRVKVCAFVGDDGVTLRIERAFSTSL